MNFVANFTVRLSLIIVHSQKTNTTDSYTNKLSTDKAAGGKYLWRSFERLLHQSAENVIQLSVKYISLY